MWTYIRFRLPWEMPTVVNFWCILTFFVTDQCLSTEITIGALLGKSTHYALTWDTFENKRLLDLFTHFHVHQYLPEKKASADRRTMMLAFKFDVSLHPMGVVGTNHSADNKYRLKFLKSMRQ